MINWVIEKFPQDNTYAEIAKKAKAQGHNVHFWSKSFIGQKDPEELPTMSLGSIEFIQALKEEYQYANLLPLAFSTFENYCCSKYYAYYQDYLFNDDNVLITAKQLEENKYYYYQKFGKEAMIFVRPDDGIKTFKAGLMDLQYFDKDWQTNYEYGLFPEDLVIVSSPKNITGEWRFVVAEGGEIIAQSCYKYQDQLVSIPSAPTGATKLVEKLLDIGYFPDTIFTMDIVQDGDGNFWLMELNSFSSAGMYACDKKKIVERVSHYVQNK